MELMTFEGLEIEMISQEVVWQDFLDALATFYQAQVREPLDSLREIRNITEKTDPNVVLLTLRDMGIDTPLDLIVNPERLLKSVYMLPLIYQHTGLDSAWRVIEFILGRRVTVKPLWTEDYIDFYTEPYGPLRVDGGTWYKTTHVSMSIQTVASDAGITLPRNQTLKDRLLSAFYSFAPINMVVDKFSFTVDIGPTPAPTPGIPKPDERDNSNIGIAGVVQKHGRRIMRYGEADVVYDDKGQVVRDFTLVGPSSIPMGDSFQFYLEERGKPYYHTEWWSDKPGLVTFDNSGNATFSNVDFDTDVTIYSRFLGHTNSKVVRILKAFDDIRFIRIEGPDFIDGGSFADYEVRVFHAHGNEVLDTQVHLVSPHASIEFNRLTASDVKEDETIALRATYKVGGVEYPAAKMVQIKHVEQSLTLHDFSIAGFEQLQENSSYIFSAKAKYSDGTIKNVLAVWSTSSSAAHVDNNGTVTTGRADGDTKVVFSATYSFRGVTKTHRFESTISPVKNELVSVSIQGPTTGIENSRLRYNCLGIFSDGTSHVVDARWECEDFYIGFDGVLEVGTTGLREKQLKIRAFVGSINSTFIVNIIRDPVVLNSLTIQGPENLHEDVPGAYQALAHYSDGSKVAIMPNWSIVGNPDWATISNQGIVSFSNPEDGLLEIQADYLKEGVRYTQTKTVVCISKTNIITGLIVSGPNLVDAGERIVLTATAIYQDGSIEQVTPQWSVRTDDSNATFVAADIIGSGVVQGRDVDSDMDVIVTARYFQEEVTYKITVRYQAPKGSDVPVSSRISGPPVFYASEIASFSQMIKFEECPNELAVSSDWSLDVPASTAAIDANGFLTVVGNRAVTMTVTATYICQGYEVVDSIVVTSVVQDSNYSTMLINGPSSVEIGESVQFTAEIFTLADVVAEGKGKVVACEWAVISDGLNIQISNNGLLRVIGAVVSPSFTLKATFTDGFETLEVTKSVAVASSQPIYGSGVIDISSEAIFEFPSVLTGNRFSLDIGTGRYGFFCYPMVWGLATFKEVGSGIVGGWDGATWPSDGTVGETAGPLTLTRTINGINTQWYMYRTNFTELGPVEYDISFS